MSTKKPFHYLRTCALLVLAIIATSCLPANKVVGMAGVLSGTIHVPLTAIFLIAEITGGYALFVPLMIVSSLAYLVARWLIPYSVYSRPGTV